MVGGRHEGSYPARKATMRDSGHRLRWPDTPRGPRRSTRHYPRSTTENCVTQRGQKPGLTRPAKLFTLAASQGVGTTLILEPARRA